MTSNVSGARLRSLSKMRTHKSCGLVHGYARVVPASITVMYMYMYITILYRCAHLCVHTYTYLVARLAQCSLVARTAQEPAKSPSHKSLPVGPCEEDCMVYVHCALAMFAVDTALVHFAVDTAHYAYLLERINP